MRPFKSSYCAIAAVAFLGLAGAQSIPSDEVHTQTVSYVPRSILTLRTQVDLVEVPVVVRDGQRRAVAGLTRDDFEIYDAGKKQAITTFSVQHFTPHEDAAGGKNAAPAAKAPAPQEVSRPRYVALLFDNLNIASADLKPVKDAAVRFVKTSLAPGDRVAVVTTARSDETEFTEDVPTLVNRVAKVTAQQRLPDGSGVDCPRIGPYEAYVIVNHIDNDLLMAKAAEYRACFPRAQNPQGAVLQMANAIWDHALFETRNNLRMIDSLVKGMSWLPGQRMILLTSGGLLTGNVEQEFDLLMAKALHSEVVINALDARGLYTEMPGGDLSQPPPRGRLPQFAQNTNAQYEKRQEEAKDDGMASLAAGTGGTFYHNSNDLAHGFRELGMVPETIYVLGFAPSDVVADGRFHSLKVRLVAGKRGSLQARLGYTAPSANGAGQAAPPSKLDSEVMASDTVADLPAGFSWVQRGTTPGITVLAHLDLSRLHLEKREDRLAQKLTLVAVLMDSHGEYVTGKRSEVELDLRQATLTRLTPTGMYVSMTLDAPVGTYAARAVVQDGMEGKIAAASAAVQVK